MGVPTVTPITEQWHAGHWIMAEPDNGMYDRAAITVRSGAGVITSGTVLGQVSVGAAAAAVLGTNTGNGTFGAIAVTAPAVAGAYTVEFDDATHFVVTSPAGAEVGHGTTGAAYAGGGLGFTITAGGTAFVPGDSFTVTVAGGSNKYVVFDPTGVDGREVATGILWSGRVDATSADKAAVAVTRGPCRGNLGELIWGPGVTANNQKLAAIAALNLLGIRLS